jgi:rRNA maturation endonuclease Nob1
MGLFNNLGKKFEKLKQSAESSADDEATHGCKECETLLYTDYDECPECGSDSVVPVRHD